MTHTTQVLSDEQHKTAIEQLETAAGQFENAANVPNAPGSKEYAEKARQIRASIATLKAVSGQEPVGEIAACLPDGVGLHVSWLAHSGQKLRVGDKLFALPPAQPAPVDERETRAQKHERNWRVQCRYNELMRDGYRGHYEAMFRVVQEEVEAARAALQCAQAPQAGGWQPIETAPKDGTLFLCWVRAAKLGEDDDGRQFESDASEVDFCRWCVCDESPNGGYFDNMAGQIADLQHITHWQPLPPAPQATKGQP